MLTGRLDTLAFVNNPIEALIRAFEYTLGRRLHWKSGVILLSDLLMAFRAQASHFKQLALVDTILNRQELPHIPDRMKSLALRGLIFHELGLVHNTRDTKRTGESLVELPPTNIIDTLESEFRDAVGNINLCEQIPLRFETRMNQYKFSTVSLPSSHSGSSAASNASSLSSSLSSSSSSPFTSPSLSSSLASSSSTITNQVPLMSSSSSLLTIEEPLLDTDLDVELDIKPTVMNEMLNLPRTSTDTIQKHWLRLHSLDTNDKRAAVRKGLLMMSYAAVDLISRAGKKAINVSLLLRTAPTCQPNIFLQRGDNVCSAGPTEICAHCWGALAEFHQISITEYDAIRKLIRKVMESIPCSPPSMPLEDPQPTPQDRVIPINFVLMLIVLIHHFIIYLLVDQVEILDKLRLGECSLEDEKLFHSLCMQPTAAVSGFIRRYCAHKSDVRAHNSIMYQTLKGSSSEYKANDNGDLSLLRLFVEEYGDIGNAISFKVRSLFVTTCL